MIETDQSDVAGRIWGLCNVLRDDGIVYHKYLSELTYLLFLKNAKQLDVEDEIPQGCRWDDLLAARGAGMLGAYRKMLTSLGEDVRNDTIRNIFSFPTTVFSHDENLRKVVDGVEQIDWHNRSKDALGDIYESLLERNATESRSGSGQYFTPRPLVNSMVSVMKPRPGEKILDPAVGTGGFLIASHVASSTRSADTNFYQGVEIERETFRLCLMNLYLHGMNGKVVHGDALTNDSVGILPADLILANPPFGVSSSSARTRREDIQHPTSNKQLAFLQYIFLAMKEGGRAAVVVPDNVLTDAGAGSLIRHELVESYDLHTVLRLPRGIFYAAGVQTNVLFFNRPGPGAGSTRAVWYYDLRTDIPNFTRRRALADSDFHDFQTAFGDDPFGHAQRKETSRFKQVSVDEIRARDYDLDVRPTEAASSESGADLADLADFIIRMEESLAVAQNALLELSSIVGVEDDVDDRDGL